jgi:imidazole glycerol-phosphate synthase subunit HisH
VKRGKVTVIDYGRGNLHSLVMALEAVGSDYNLISDPAGVADADQIILPGVGAFGDCMQGLRDRGLIEPLKSAVLERGVRFLGICVGMQIMADAGEEFGQHEGLGFVRGVVRRLPEPNALRGANRVPNVGWQSLTYQGQVSLSSAHQDKQMCYFVHSYALDEPDPADVLATFDFNGRNVPAIIQRQHMLGFQFHPEKSASAGLALLKNFVETGV